MSFETIRSFKPSVDRGYPASGLVADLAGNLFGTTCLGMFDIAFELSGANHDTLTVLHIFSNNNGNGINASKMIADAAGNLFGTTVFGGDYNAGTVFELSGPDHQIFTILHSFSPTRTDGSTDTGGPSQAGALFADFAGNLYGTTYGGGTFNAGTVFELSGVDHQTFRIVHNFSGADGAFPSSELVAGSDGNLFGTTSGGGSYNKGTIFELSGTRYQSFSILRSFNGTDGAGPTGSLLIDTNGNIYGTTAGGGGYGSGTVFRLGGSSHDNMAIIHDFSFNSKVSLNSTFRADGAYPTSLFIDDNQSIFGTTVRGGAHHKGTLFEISGQEHEFYKILHNFSGRTNGEGSYPIGALVQGSEGGFYGVTAEGGDGYVGTVFKFTPQPQTKILISSFSISNTGQYVINGSTLPSFAGTTVNLMDGTRKLATATVAADGSFFAAVNLIGNGNHSLIATYTEAHHKTVTSDAFSIIHMAPTTYGVLKFNTDIAVGDADFAGITGLKSLWFSGRGSSSVILGENVATDFGANPIKVIADSSVRSLTVDGRTLSSAVTVKGSSGADTVIGGTGNDRFTGGAGADLFDLTQGGRDTITDFVHGTDHIRFAGRNMTDLNIIYSRGDAIIAIDSTHHATLKHIAVGTLAASDFLFA